MIIRRGIKRKKISKLQILRRCKSSLVLASVRTSAKNY